MFLEDCDRYNKNKGITEGGTLECKKVIRKDIGEPLAEMYIVDIVASEAAGAARLAGFTARAGAQCPRSGRLCV